MRNSAGQLAYGVKLKITAAKARRLARLADVTASGYASEKDIFCGSGLWLSCPDISAGVFIFVGTSVYATYLGSVALGKVVKGTTELPAGVMDAKIQGFVARHGLMVDPECPEPQWWLTESDLALRLKLYEKKHKKH